MVAERQEQKNMVKVMVLQIVGAAISAAVFSSIYEEAAAISFGLVLGMTLVWLGYVVFAFFQKPRSKSFLFLPVVLIFYLGFSVVLWKEHQLELLLKSPISLEPLPMLSITELRSQGSSTETMQSWMDALIRSDGYPSLQIAVADTSGIIFSHTAGNPEHSAQNRAAIYPVASVSKLFTNLLTIRLAEEGVLHPQDSLSKYLPPGTPITSNPDIGAQITLEMLATHSSGLVRSTGGAMRESDATYDGLLLDRLYQQLGAHETEFPPGTDKSYSNLGFGILGVALEKASGMNYRDLVHSRIIKPFGLKDTDVLDYTNPDQLQRLAQPHLAGAGTESVERASLKKRLVGSGGIVSTADDLARLGSMFLTAERMGMSVEKYTAYFSPVYFLNTDGSVGEASHYSLFGRIRKTDATGACLKKSGGRAGVSAYMIVCPQLGAAAAITTNRSVDPYEGSPKQIGNLIMRALSPQK